MNHLRYIGQKIKTMGMLENWVEENIDKLFMDSKLVGDFSSEIKGKSISLRM